MQQKYLSDLDLAARYNCHRTTPWRWAHKGTFPKPIKISPGFSRWLAEDVEAHERAAIERAQGVQHEVA